MAEKLYVTRRGLVKLQAEVQRLDDELQKLQAQVGEVAEVGGNQWHDNASYEALVIDIRGADWRLAEAHRCLAAATLIGEPGDLDHVYIGTKVKILQDGHERTIEVVGYGESDPDLDLIMYRAPIAALIMGKCVGDVVTGTIGGRKTEIKVLEISKGGE